MSAFKNERGSWSCKFRYTTWDGKTKQKKKEGFETKKAALDYENNFLNNLAQTPDITFDNLVKNYLADCSARLKQSTIQTKQHIFEKLLLPYFAELPINQISTVSVRRWQNELISSGEYSETYLRTVHTQLSTVMNYACKYYKLPQNPARECGSMGAKKADSMQIWTVDEFNSFLSAVLNKPINKPLFSLFFYGGFRQGELLALTYNDFDFTVNTVSVTKTYSRINKEEIVTSPKTKKSNRVVTLPPSIMQLVSDYHNKLYDYEPNQRLFAVTKHYITHEIERGCKLSGVKKIRCHDLRHSHASLLIEMGFSPVLIAERLGHENVETTLNTYSHLYPNEHSEVAEKMEKLIQK